MNNQIASDSANSAKTLAQQIAKQMANEPSELLKDLRHQATNVEYNGQVTTNPFQKPEPAPPNTGEHEQKDKMRSERLIQALNKELEDIKRQKLLEELQRRISEGEEVPLHEYDELTMDQKQVLMAQMEAVKIQRQNAKYSSGGIGVPSISSKPSRRFGAGQKQQAQKEQTHVEKPIQNSS